MNWPTTQVLELTNEMSIFHNNFPVENSVSVSEKQCWYKIFPEKSEDGEVSIVRIL